MALARSRISLIATRASRRANGAPRQWWIPNPNARCAVSAEGEIKPVSGTEPTRVTIGGAYEYDDATDRRDLNAGYLSIGDGNPGHTLQRRICP